MGQERTISSSDDDLGDAIETVREGSFAPLREPVFRNIWTASLFSNFGQLILGVGIAWEMARMTDSPAMVALVQSAMMIPLMLVTLPAGALADMFDRRKIAMAGLAAAALFSGMLSALAWAGLTTPWMLLGFCVLIGAGVALFAPSWQSSIGEQVSRARLPAAIALGTISYNIARSFGPALGGLIVLAGGAQAAFAINALCYLPLLLAFYVWRRAHAPSRLPPERIGRAIVTGARYAMHARPVRVVLVRAALFGLGSATASALAPLVAKDLLGGNASTYGILLGATGLGAVGGALLLGRFDARFGIQTMTRLLPLVSTAALLIVGLSRSLPLTCIGMALSGVGNITYVALLNITVQTSVPRWVTARALSLFSAALTGGIAIGAWIWGQVATIWSLEGALIGSAMALLALPLLSIVLPLQTTRATDTEEVSLNNALDVSLAITHRSGPVVIEIDYDVDPARARDFYDVMRRVQAVRLRNGGFDWSLSRDIGRPEIWTERYQCPTWGDYLRMRHRFTQADVATRAAARAFDRSARGARSVRRKLERPFGSVRWQADSPDMHQDRINYIAP